MRGCAASCAAVALLPGLQMGDARVADCLGCKALGALQASGLPAG